MPDSGEIYGVRSQKQESFIGSLRDLWSSVRSSREEAGAPIDLRSMNEEISAITGQPVSFQDEKKFKYLDNIKKVNEKAFDNLLGVPTESKMWDRKPGEEGIYAPDEVTLAAAPKARLREQALYMTLLKQGEKTGRLSRSTIDDMIYQKTDLFPDDQGIIRKFITDKDRVQKRPFPRPGETVKYSDLYDHPRLTERVPELKDKLVSAHDSSIRDRGISHLDDGLMTIRDDLSNFEKPHVVTHEQEHLLSDVQGLPAGSSPQIELARLPAAKEMADTVGRLLEDTRSGAVSYDELLPLLQDISDTKAYLENGPAYRNYLNDSGERMADEMYQMSKFLTREEEKLYRPMSRFENELPSVMSPGARTVKSWSPEIETGLRESAQPNPQTGFYSRLAKGILEHPKLLGDAKQMKADTLLNKLRQLTSKEELEFMGLPQMLGAKGSEKVAVEPIVKYIAEVNLAKLTEVNTLGNRVRNSEVIDFARFQGSHDVPYATELDEFAHLEGLEEAPPQSYTERLLRLPEENIGVLEDARALGPEIAQTKAARDALSDEMYSKATHENMIQRIESLEGTVPKEFKDFVETENRLVEKEDRISEAYFDDGLKKGEDFSTYDKRHRELSTAYQEARATLEDFRRSTDNTRASLVDAYSEAYLNKRDELTDQEIYLEHKQKALREGSRPAESRGEHFGDFEGTAGWTRELTLESGKAELPVGEKGGFRGSPQREILQGDFNRTVQPVIDQHGEFSPETADAMSEFRSRRIREINYIEQDQTAEFRTSLPDTSGSKAKTRLILEAQSDQEVAARRSTPYPPITPFDKNASWKAVQASLYKAASEGEEFVAFSSPYAVEARYKAHLVPGKTKFIKSMYDPEHQDSLIRRSQREIAKITGEEPKIVRRNIQGVNTPALQLTPSMREKIKKKGFKISQNDLAREVLFG